MLAPVIAGEMFRQAGKTADDLHPPRPARVPRPTANKPPMETPGRVPGRCGTIARPGRPPRWHARRPARSPAHHPARSPAPVACPSPGPVARPSPGPVARPSPGPVTRPSPGPVACPGSMPVARPGRPPIARPGRLPRWHARRPPITRLGRLPHRRPGRRAPLLVPHGLGRVFGAAPPSPAGQTATTAESPRCYPNSNGATPLLLALGVEQQYRSDDAAGPSGRPGRAAGPSRTAGWDRRRGCGTGPVGRVGQGRIELLPSGDWRNA